MFLIASSVHCLLATNYSVLLPSAITRSYIMHMVSAIVIMNNGNVQCEGDMGEGLLEGQESLKIACMHFLCKSIGAYPALKNWQFKQAKKLGYALTENCEVP